MFRFLNSQRFLIISIFITFCIFMMASISTPITAGDGIGYAVLMGKGTLSEYLKTLFTMWRPWVTPVFFSLFGKYSIGTAYEIIVAQSILMFVAFQTFFYVVSKEINSKFQNLMWVVLCTSCFTVRYYQINAYLLSDSIGFTLLLFYLAVVFSFRKIWKSHSLAAANIGFFATGLLMAGTRDSNLIFFPAGVAFILALNRDLPKSIKFLIPGIVIVFIWAQSGSSWSRHALNMRNILSGYAMVNPEPRKYFAERGLTAPDVQGLVAQKWCSSDDAITLRNHRLLGLETEVKKEASVIWVSYLATHPEFIFSHLREDLDCFFPQFEITGLHLVDYLALGSPTFATGSNPINPESPFNVFPLRVKLFLLPFLVVVICLLYLKFKLSMLVFSGPYLAILGFTNSVASFFGDFWNRGDVLRHCMIGSAIFDIGFTISLVVVIFFTVEKLCLPLILKNFGSRG